MVRHSKNCTRDVDSPVNDLHTYEELELVQDPPVEHPTIVERELWQCLLNMENILCDVVHENIKLQS